MDCRCGGVPSRLVTAAPQRAAEKVTHTSFCEYLINMEETCFDFDFLGNPYLGFYITEVETAQSLLSKLMEKDCVFGLDTETAATPEFRSYPRAALFPQLANIRLLQVSDGETCSVAFDLLHLPLELFTEFLNTKQFVAHNATFDLKMLKYHTGCEINLGCTMLAYLMLVQALYSEDEVGERPKATLEAVAEQVLGVKLKKSLGVSDWSIPNLTFEQVKYAVIDAMSVVKIAEKLAKGLEKNGLTRYYKLVKQAQHPIAEIELNGIYLDKELHMQHVIEWKADLMRAKQEVMELTGLSNITDHTMSAWLTSTLDPNTLALWPRTDTGKLKTDTHTFSDFSYLDIVKPFAEYKKKLTLCSTFGSNLLQFINPASHRIHSNYFICGARTGRLSSGKPNAQNMPRDTSVRSSFRAQEGNVIVCADYGQIELRCAAEISQDPTMLRAYREGIDLHQLTASKVMHKPLADVTKEERQMAKAINFGLLFGLGAKKFSHYAKKSYGVEVTEKEAFEAVETFRETYAGYREWQLQQANNAEMTKRCTTPMGKLRRLPDESTFGNSMNHPVQGGAAEVMLSALYELSEVLKDYPQIKIIGTVHDEILLECPEEDKFIAGKLLEQAMYVGYLKVFPNGITRDLVEAGAGKSWADAKAKENKLQL